MGLAKFRESLSEVDQVDWAGLGGLAVQGHPGSYPKQCVYVYTYICIDCTGKSLEG